MSNHRAIRLSATPAGRLYILMSVNHRTGNRVPLMVKPESHRACEIIMSKHTRYPWRSIEFHEVQQCQDAADCARQIVGAK